MLLDQNYLKEMEDVWSSAKDTDYIRHDVILDKTVLDSKMMGFIFFKIVRAKQNKCECSLPVL